MTVAEMDSRDAATAGESDYSGARRLRNEHDSVPT